MKIIFEQTGGFMGRSLSLTLDFNDLSPQDAATLKSMLEQADFWNIQPDKAPRPARDDFHYRLTVETEKGQHTVRTSDTNAPAQLRPLIHELSKRARAAEK
jgi:hypothetical protein